MVQKVFIGNSPIEKVYQGDTLIKYFGEITQDKTKSNEVPYIATYYIEPIVDINDEVVIAYYVTDYDQKEYKEVDDSERFTILYGVDGIYRRISNLSAGDHLLNFGRLEEGKRLITLQAIDSRGRRSHRLYQEIKIIDKVQQEKEIQAHSYYADEIDLVRYLISKEDTNPVETTLGINQLIGWAIEAGYKKLTLPPGIYRIDENSGINLQGVSHFILDLNGATLKLNPNALSRVMMVSLKDCEDCHVINGVIEGDVNTHDYAHASNDSEWVNAVTIDGGGYNSFEDLTIRDITGYGTNTMFGSDAQVGAENGFMFEPGDIIKGEWIESTDRYSSKNYIPLASYRLDTGTEKYNYIRKGFFQVGAYLGYQGNVTDNWVYKATFYDSNKTYMETIEGYAYRRMYIPDGAEYVRITLFSAALPNSNISLFSVDAPINCCFKNIYHKNIRAVGMALCAFINLLVEGCTFDYCGYALAKCAFDAEDGWDLMQDLTFRKNQFMNNPYGNFLTCAGHNFIIEDNEAIGMYFWERTRSYVSRRNTIIFGSDYKYQDMRRTGYVRIYDNKYEIASRPTVTSKEALLIMKNETYRHCSPYCKNGFIDEGAVIKIIDSQFEYDESKGINGAPGLVQLIRCTFNFYKAYLSSKSTYIDCIFNNCMDLRLHGDAEKTFIRCYFNSCAIKLQGYADSLFKGCTMSDFGFNVNDYYFPEQAIRMEECMIEMNGRRHFLNINTGVPVILRNSIVVNRDNRYIVANFTKNDKSGVKVILQGNTFIQSAGYIITGINLTKGDYTFILDDNTIEGEAIIVDPKYEVNDVVMINPDDNVE